ncbi:hypothetical protein K0U00_31925, partial [Paenibacillus sepulcri]|nr:hypothetical protein [Paenibacillus sepulcri]
ISPPPNPSTLTSMSVLPYLLFSMTDSPLFHADICDQQEETASPSYGGKVSFFPQKQKQSIEEF